MNVYTVSLWLCLAAPGVLAAVAQNQAPAKTAQAGAKKAAEKKEKVSEADQIIRLQRFLDADTKTLAKTKWEIDDPKNEYRQAEDAYKKLEATLALKTAELKKLQAKGAKAEAAKLESAAAALEQQRGLARDRFDIAIKERKLLQERVALLTVMTEKIRRAIALLEGAVPPGTKEVAPAAPTIKGAEQAPAKTVAPMATPQSKPTLPGRPGDVELLEAQKTAARKDADVETANEKLKAINDRILFVNKNVDLDTRILDILREKAANASAIQAFFKKELAAKPADVERASLQAQLADAEKLSAATDADIRETTDRLTNLHNGEKKLQGEQTIAEDNFSQKSQDAASAEDRVKFLASPLAPHNVIAWLWAHVPTIAIVVIAMVLLQWLVRVASRRIVEWVSRHQLRGNQKDRENRADTLAGVFRNTASFFIFVGGTLMILQGLGIPILPLLGGAAAGGLAVAFGAQNLIKDYLSGFMFLLEDQYGINDVIKIAGIAGQVEQITLRMTVLRDSEGTVHFIPHSTITTVSNMSHRWARAFFEIRVAYKENIDRVMQVLLQLCKEMRTDPTFGPFILEDADMWGVDQLSENGITIQFVLRTAPVKQWAVKRELLRRIKDKFDELGIEMPHYEYSYNPRSMPSGNGMLANADGKQAGQ